MNRISVIAYILILNLIRRKDLYVLLILMATMLVTLMSFNIFGLGGAVRYIADIGLMMAWLFSWILAIVITARELPGEENRGTILNILAKPVSRFELIAGKWLGAWIITCLATLAFYILVATIIAFKGDALQTHTLLQCFILHSVSNAVLTSISLALSTRMNSDAASTLSFVISGAAFLIVPRIPAFLAAESGLRADLLLLIYNILPHMEVFDLRMRVIHDFGPVGSTLLLKSSAYGATLTALFLFLAFISYRNKRFSRAQLN